MAANVTLAFPPPPPFYTLYTDDNIQAHSDWKRSLSSSSSSSSSADPLSLSHPNPPPGIPQLDPPPPLEGPYVMFGEILNTVDQTKSLTELGIPQLIAPESTDRVKELKELNHALLLAFLELTNILCTRPKEASATIERIRLLLINMHYALNSYRPYQARDVLRLMMEQQIKHHKETTLRIKRSILHSLE